MEEGLVVRVLLLTSLHTLLMQGVIRIPLKPITWNLNMMLGILKADW